MKITIKDKQGNKTTLEVEDEKDLEKVKDQIKNAIRKKEDTFNKVVVPDVLG